ncbi:Imm5 family immunity protein [Dysgonomonas sp. 520]|uniref:Imm5 family immunity protein n=1 Tax=Dysgonomonas sp. 520 TaxID=2302931 RepID=UPI0013D6AED0|nr:Imm5 family immunity protein [Dysgonomonas sp. 520]
MAIFGLFKKNKAQSQPESLAPEAEEVRVERSILTDDHINILKDIVDASRDGHLALSHRIRLLSLLNDVKTVNRVFFECAKKVLPIYEEGFGKDESLLLMMSSINEFLYFDVGEQSSFFVLADLLKDQVFGFLEGEKKMAALAGMTVVSLAYSIAFDAGMMLEIDEYCGENDDVFDWEGWNPDYYASMTCSGGSPFDATGSIELRKEFWNWYLDTVLSLSKM